MPERGNRAVVICATCGMPGHVVFDAEGEIDKVFAVCGHMKKPEPDPEPERAA